jgi:hypothetical protein
MIAAQYGGRRSRRASARRAAGQPGCTQPNDVDLRRVLQALDERARYRYVAPAVEGVEGGYLVTSPCCSRNVDQEGGVIEVARMQYVQDRDEWLLYRKDHAGGAWVLHSCNRRLSQMLAVLRDDPDRVFWP